MPFLRGRRPSPRATDATTEDVDIGPANGTGGNGTTSNPTTRSSPEGKSNRPGGGLVATLSNSFRRRGSGNKAVVDSRTKGGQKQQADDEEEPVFDTQESETEDTSAAAPYPRRRIKKKKALVIDTSDQDDDDPVMAVFEARARATARVRFAAEPEIQGEETKKSEDATDDEETNAVTITNSTTTEPTKEKEAITPTKQQPSSPTKEGGASFGIHKFMKNALFGKGTEETEAGLQKEIDQAAKEVAGGESPKKGTQTTHVDLVRTRSGRVATSFHEDPMTKARVNKLLDKARRAQSVHYRYAYAVKCHVKAMEYLKEANYPDDHSLVVKVAKALAQSHHLLSSLNTSAGIVKMGLKYEQGGELVRALKMYTIAFRMRRDTLSDTHPSLVVLLNMLGSIQIKRGELDEALQIYQLALSDDASDDDDSETNNFRARQRRANMPTNLLARAVSYRELSTIYEEKNEIQKALEMCDKSLECLAAYKLEQMHKSDLSLPSPSSLSLSPTGSNDNSLSMRVISPTSVEVVRETDDDPDASVTPQIANMDPFSSGTDGMEVLIQELAEHSREEKTSLESLGDETPRPETYARPSAKDYESFFPPQLDEVIRRKKHRRNKQKASKLEKQAEQVNIDAALTLHQIAQLHRSQGDFEKALSVYQIAIRGMKYCLGKNHPNVAAILGNIGNLQKEMNDLDSAFDTYQQVLGIESYRLGLSHPDVAITLHNIATIDAARGKHEHAIALYGQVINLQRKLFGPDHASVAVTAACLADVYDHIGDIKAAVEWYEEAARIKALVMGRHSLEVARLLHKLGKLASARLEYHLADSLVSRAILIYRLNKLPEDDEWMVDACRDAADSEAAIAMGQGVTFEC
jgi:tetratricopeptide (TPR) repeat protein